MKKQPIEYWEVNVAEIELWFLKCTLCDAVFALIRVQEQVHCPYCGQKGCPPLENVNLGS